ncbi:MAG TPA: circadian clock KaiB family protein [Acidobacteriota bacterium]|nr:circadian clock KaiB family protein [Acidobacteriota bacterium]
MTSAASSGRRRRTRVPLPEGPEDALARARARERQTRYVLRLYVAGMTPRSAAAIRQVTAICEDRLKGRYDLEVIDIYRQPKLAKGEQIIAAPTLIKRLPLPLRRLVGDMANTERVLVGLDLRPYP